MDEDDYVIRRTNGENLFVVLWFEDDYVINKGKDVEKKYIKCFVLFMRLKYIICNYLCFCDLKMIMWLKKQGCEKTITRFICILFFAIKKLCIYCNEKQNLFVCEYRLANFFFISKHWKQNINSDKVK